MYYGLEIMHFRALKFKPFAAQNSLYLPFTEKEFISLEILYQTFSAKCKRRNLNDVNFLIIMSQ